MAELISEINAAVQYEDFEEVNELLSELEDSQIDLSNENDIAVFYVACMSGNVDMLKKFVDAGFPIDSPLKAVPDEWSILRGYSGFTGLHFAFEHQRLNAVQFLLNHRANIFIPNNSGITPLHILLRTITPIYILLKFDTQSHTSHETYDQIINMILQTYDQGHNNLENNVGVTYLHLACTRDEPEAVEKFLQSGASVNQAVGTFFEHEGYSPLHFAAQYNCVKVAKFLLEHGANVNQLSALSSKKMSALHLTDSSELVQLLVQHGADVTLKNTQDKTPLHRAFEERNYKIMDILLSAHLNIKANPTNSIGLSHFHIACTRNNEDVVKHFLKNRVSINDCLFTGYRIKYKDRCFTEDLNWHGCSPLHFAVAFNVSKIVKLLLSHKADVKIQDARGFTALHMACKGVQERYEEFLTSRYKLIKPKPKKIDWTRNRKEHINIILLLLKHKSDVNCHDKFGNTPVFYSYLLCAFEDEMLHEVRDDFMCEMLARRSIIFSILLKRKVDLETCYKNGSILHYMVEESLNPDSIFGYCELELLQKFFKKGLTVDALNKNKLTPLFILVQKTARTEFISFLIRYGANVNFHEPEEHSTLLHVALKNVRDTEQLIFDLVLGGGADPNAKQLDGTTALHLLAGEYCCYSYIFEKLIGKGADINAQDAKGRTPLFRACYFWNDGLAKLLLEYGADINIEDNRDKTVLCVIYEEKLMENYMSEHHKMMMLSRICNVLSSYITKNRSSVSNKVLSAFEKVEDYLNMLQQHI